MGLAKGSMAMLAYEYDFAREGGAVGQIVLLPAVEEGKSSPMEEDYIVTGWSLKVESAITSGGTPTITLGDGSDFDGYAADVFALVGSDNDVVNSGAVAGALIWDDTNDHAIHHRVGSTSANAQLTMDVGTATITAGKLKVYMMGYRAY